MPQFDPANFAPQIFWLALIFSVLYFLVVRPTLPKIGRTIDERSAYIDSELSTAAAARESAAQATSGYEEIGQKARAEALSYVSAAKAKAHAQTEAYVAQANARLSAQISESETALQSARARALAQMDQITQEVTESLVIKLTGMPVSRDAVADAVRRVVQA